MIQNVLLTRQTHIADRAGKHYDYRIVIGDKALSWATKKELPENNKPIILWEQPVHTASYALSKKVIIPAGNYGAGTTTLDFVRKAKLETRGPDSYVLSVAGGERYLLKKMPKYDEGAWLFKSLTKSTTPPEKNKYLEKAAMLITQYKDPETGTLTWIPENKPIPNKGLIPTGYMKYIRKKVK